jgi:hypothetical protein
MDEMYSVNPEEITIAWNLEAKRDLERNLEWGGRGRGERFAAPTTISNALKMC